LQEQTNFDFASFIWRVSTKTSRLPCEIFCVRVSGLGSVAVVHRQFALLILGLSAAQAATFADRISLGRMTLRDFYPQIIMINAR
jgi:hypothetical protein